MTNASTLEMRYQIQAIIESHLTKSKRNDTPLSIAKIILKFDPKEGDTFQQLLSFMYDFLDYAPFVGIGNGQYFFLMEDTKIHTAVIALKNMLVSANITYNGQILGVGVTTVEKSEKLEETFTRVTRLCESSAKTQPREVHYATSNFSYSDKNAPNGLRSIFVKEPRISVYGFYKEAPMIQNGEIIEYNEHEFILKLSKEYLGFLKREAFVYLENALVPDIMQSNIIKIDMEKSYLYLGEIKFMDDSPVHRKNIRVTPHRPIKATLTHSDDFLASTIVANISENAVLLTTQLPKIEELLAKDLRNRKFDLHFFIENDDESKEEIYLNAMIFKITGNQIVLNIYPDSQTQTIIQEYILKCQKLLLLEAQGIRV